MRIIHDPDRCASVGMCEAAAPEVFAIARDGSLVVLQQTPGVAVRAAVQEAVEACPTQALRIEA